jgi:6-phosphogluconolactonase
MELKKYQDREIMMLDLVGIIASELETALHHEDRATLVVPGGTTPGPIFDDLCSVHMDWSRVDVMLSDERWVPEGSERSNTRLLKERLLIEEAAKARYLPLYANADKPEDVLAELETVIVPSLPISVLLLGMGADMHTASIFPGADNLELALDAHAPVLVPMRAPGAPEPRVTLSARVLDEAVNKHLVITGSEKLEALEAAQKLSPEDAPIRSVLTGTTVHWAK